MSQINVNIVITGLLGILSYIIVMNLPFFKKNSRHGGFLTIGMAVATIILAIVLYVMKTIQN